MVFLPLLPLVQEAREAERVVPVPTKRSQYLLPKGISSQSIEEGWQVGPVDHLDEITKVGTFVPAPEKAPVASDETAPAPEPDHC
jgi:hypothetical protein